MRCDHRTGWARWITRSVPFITGKGGTTGVYLEMCIPRHQDAPLFICPVYYDLDQGFQRDFNLSRFLHEP